MQKSYIFDSPDTYDFDSSFIEFIGGVAKLKIGQSDDLYSQSFSSDTDFDYDADLAEFSGGVLRQLDKRPANATFGASYSSSVNASWVSSGSLTGTANNGASVSAGRLNCTGGGSKSVNYDITGKLGNQKGAIRLKWTPNYNGTPTDTQLFFTIAESEGSNNSKIQLMHHSNGALFFLVNDADGANVYSNSLLVFNAVAGTESIIEVGWDLDTDMFYVFGNGFSLGDLGMALTLSDCSFLQIGGSDGPTDGYFDDVLLFNQNIHTANHDPAYSVPDAAFVASEAVLPEMEYNAGDGTFLEATDFDTVETNAPKYTIQVGRSGNYLYWTGSAWATSDGSLSQANTMATIAANIENLPLDGEIYVQVKVHFATSNVQQSISQLDLEILESTTYDTGPHKITPQGRFEAAKLISFSVTDSIPASTGIKYIVEVDSIKMYWNGTAFRPSNGTYAQSNTKQEIEENIVQFIDGNSFIKLITFLKTDDSEATPEITSAIIQYDEDVNGMRGYFNSVLEFIGAESLTDEEFDSIDLENIDDPVANYNALLEILQSREVSSDMTSRLQYYYQAQGVSVTAPANATSNIFVGATL